MPKNRKSVPRVDRRETVPFGKLNYILFTAGLLLITAGWFLLRAGHISISPLMLILGYCVVIPLAIIIAPREDKGSSE